MEHNFRGHIKSINYDSFSFEVKVDFITPDKFQIIEDYYISKDFFGFYFRNNFKKSKTYDQLQYYYWLLNKILFCLNITPTAQIIKSFDDQLKDLAFPPEKLDVGGQILPLPFLKRDSDTEQMSYMIQYILDKYGDLLRSKNII